MSLYRRFEHAAVPSLVTTNVANRERLFSSETAARMLIRVLYEARSETGFSLLAFVAMPDHVHLVLSSPTSHHLGRIVQLVKGRFSHRYNRQTGNSGALWQDRYHERALRNESDLFAAIEYVHSNPVMAGLVSEASAFPWSSASEQYSTDLEMHLSQAKA